MTKISTDDHKVLEASFVQDNVNSNLEKTDSIAFNTMSRRKVLTMAGIGITALPLASTQAFSAVADSNYKLPDPYPASTLERELNVISLDRLEVEAREVIPKAGYEFVSGGAGKEWTLRENKRAFNDYRIAAKRLEGLTINDIDISTSLLGNKLSSPVMVAPMGAHAMVHDKGERDTAKGAGLANTLYCSSGASNASLEEIAHSTTGPKWFQLYWNNDINVTRALLTRAKEAGYSAIVITADALGPGQPEDFKALGSPFRPDRGYGNHDPKKGGFGNFLDMKTDLTPADIRYVKQFTGLPVVIKGVLRPDDADTFIKAGADAIQVSNHGGRQIDGVPASIAALPAIAAAVNKRVPIILDGGIRYGVDVIRAVALGADAVMVGRPILYGLGLGGAKGVESVLNYLNDDLRLNMLMTGARRLSDLSPDYIAVAAKSNKRQNQSVYLT